MPAQVITDFISYSRDDSEFDLRLAQDLKAAGANVWLDQLDIKPGRPWDNAIEDALIYNHAVDFNSRLDYSNAAPLYKRACDLGVALNSKTLGSYYGFGYGDHKEPQEAAILLQKSCIGNIPGGCQELGVLYKYGNGVAKDTKKAASLMQEACNGNDVDGCEALGLLYEYGDGATRDTGQAKTFYQKACNMGNQAACSQLKGAKFQ